MQWYHNLWHDEQMRQHDPAGYGMGLAIGYVVIPALLIITAGLITYILLGKGE